MLDQDKTKQQLIDELGVLRRRIGAEPVSALPAAAGSLPWEGTDPRWHALLAGAPVFILILDREGRICFINHTDSGAASSQLLGRPIWSFCRDEIREALRECVQRVFQTGRPDQCEGPAWRLDEQQHWYTAYVGPIVQDGRVVAVSVISINVTDRKRAENALQTLNGELERRVEQRTAELRDANDRLQAQIAERQQSETALRESEQRLHSICDSALDGVVMLDSSGKAVYWNPAAERMFGYTSAEMAGRDLHALLAPVVFRDRALAAFHEFATSGHGSAIGNVLELTAQRRDGSEFPIELALSVFTLQQRWCAAAIVRDVTQRRQAEQALLREQKTLEHLLQSSDHERQLIAYEIHDGLAQQLAGAIMQFQTFAHLRHTQPHDAARAFDAGMTMLQQGHFEARRLISGVRPPILDEEGIVAAVSHLVNEERRKNGPKIEYLSDVEFHRLTPILENAAYRIAQEALGNACRHSQSAKVRVELVQQDDRIRIDVQDWGRGFQPADVEPGRFGLEGIRERARLLGGTATIHSVPGTGTRIVVELPVVLRKDE